MRYRVQYLVGSERRSAKVEAGSPEEAVVKFRHTCADPDRDPKADSQVLSVSPDPSQPELAW